MASDNKYQGALLDAIDYLVNNRVQSLDRDKTIVATIVTCSNAITQEYKLSYNGGIIVAYAQDNANYSKDQRVYVLIPQGDMTQRKVIVGRATNANSNDNNITFVSSLLSDYNTIGKNSVNNNGLDPVCGLNSYLKGSYELLYQRVPDAEHHNKIDVNQEELRSYLSGAEAVMLEGSFKTRLPKAHRSGKAGKYGLQIVLAFRNKDYAATDDFNDLPQKAIKHVSYSIDSDSMTGNPMLFENWTDQYNIFSFDKDTFLYVESIMAYCQDFVTEDNKSQAELWGSDVFVKDVEFYGLSKIEAKNGDYVLRLSTPNGAIFKSTTKDEELTALCQVKKQQASDLSDATTFYWFAKDDRVSSSSEDYHLYGGSGWRYLRGKGANKLATFTGYENRAYENKYMVVAVYKSEVILKERFSLYNEACSRDIKITSNLGVRFSFDRGVPQLTCTIGGKESDFEVNEGRDDSLFSFSWSVTDSSTGATVALNQTYDELFAEYKSLLAKFNDDSVAKEDRPSYSDLAAVKSRMAQMEGVTFDRNHLSYPMSKVQTSATFSCSVYMRENDTADSFFIGSATITLSNEGESEPTGYSIIIENGDQVFQYSESGVSPCSDRYTDPLEIRPLACHFYDPAGLEVNPDTYSLVWQFPTSDTMIKSPTTLKMNPATGKIEWLVQETCAFEIFDSYDYFSLDNQILCIVKYDGIDYTRYTNFTFTKVGENGTNGTDVVTKISSKKDSQDKLLAIEVRHEQTQDNQEEQINIRYNNGLRITEEALQFDLYNKNVLLDTSNINKTWKLSGAAAKSKHLTISSNGIISYQTEPKGDTKNGFRNTLIVRASADYSEDGGARQTYYAFYPMPVIEYIKSGLSYTISFDKTKTLKAITYNADGRFPAYNQKQGVFFSLDGANVNSKYIVLQAEGGASDDTTTAAFDLGLVYGDDKNVSARVASLYKTIIDTTTEDGTVVPMESTFDHVYIHPHDTYDGAETNNLVHGVVYASKGDFEAGNSAEAQFYLPIHMSLNTYGLSSLNAWDGTKIEINEDKNYILAPQIGAGVKNSENQFTGIVMGKAVTYPGVDIKESDSIGLLGYADGKQSIWLDAETGNATFGLPESRTEDDNKYTEGRIELRPGGTSRIGNWSIGSRSLYNMWKAPAMESRKGQDGLYYAYKYDDSTGSWTRVGEGSSEDPATKLDIKNTYYGTNMPSATPEKVYESYKIDNSEHTVDGATISFSPYSQGIILNSNPAYFSLKSMPLTRFNSNIRFDAANTVLKEGDSIEVEMDPKKPSVFSIYRHTPYIDPDTGKTIPSGVDKNLPAFTRYPLVGINSNGQFYTNAIQDQESSMGIGKVGAFGKTAADNAYIGAQFAYGKSNILKFYVKNNSAVAWNNHDDPNYKEKDSSLFLSPGTEVENEYDRPFKIYGDSVELYAPDLGGRALEQSSHCLKISQTDAFFGHNGVASLSMPTNGETTLNITKGGLEVSVKGLSSITTDGGLTLTSKGAAIESFGNGRTTTVHGDDLTVASSSLKLSGGEADASVHSSLELYNQGAGSNANYGIQLYFSAKNSNGDGSSQRLSMSSNGTTLAARNGLTFSNSNSGRTYIKNDSDNGIVLNATSSTFDHSSDGAAGARISLMPANGEHKDHASHYAIQDGRTSIISEAEGTGSASTSYIKMTPGIATEFINVVKGDGGTGNIKADGDIYSATNITAAANVKAHELMYDNNYTVAEGKYHTCTAQSVWSFIEDIYDSLNSLQTQADSISSRVSTIEDTYATKNWVDSNFVSGSSSDFVTKSVFNDHTHTFWYSTKRFSINGSSTNEGADGVSEIATSRGTMRVTVSTP